MEGQSKVLSLDWVSEAVALTVGLGNDQQHHWVSQPVLDAIAAHEDLLDISKSSALFYYSLCVVPVNPDFISIRCQQFLSFGCFLKNCLFFPVVMAPNNEDMGGSLSPGQARRVRCDLSSVGALSSPSASFNSSAMNIDVSCLPPLLP